MKFKFIDLFAGIGGFHQAMSSLGGECVFASEIDKYAIETYMKNFNVDSDNDITKVDPSDLDDYDVLCGGFPCQSFSKAGHQKGFEEVRGTLFYDIVRLLKYRISVGNPVKYFILENVRNLVSHDSGNTYSTIKKVLTKELGYIIPEEPVLLSPHQIGIPQLRDRVFILGVHKDYTKKRTLKINFEKSKKKNICNIYDIVEDKKVDKIYYISKYEETVLKIWDEFIKGVEEWTIGYPIWADYFKCTENLDSYPQWKKKFIEKNILIYKNNKKFIDRWLKKHNNLKELSKTHRKFEWQASNHINSIYEGVIQFRPSGIRVKRPTEFPALVAMVQIPIIGKYKRRLTVEETAKLQSFDLDYKHSNNMNQAYKQLGNSVNVDVVKFLAKQIIK